MIRFFAVASRGALSIVLWIPAFGAPHPGTEGRARLTIPRVDRAPVLEDFIGMRPSGDWAADGRLAKVEGFIQHVPTDGAPSSQRTEAYLGYDQTSLYVVFVAFDSEPRKIRARMARREDVYSDDVVEVLLDTFHDQRRAYSFAANPYGVQIDSLWTEGKGYDDSFDTLWHSRGKITEAGFVVWMAIPFKSLRFSTTREQVWGIQFTRFIIRTNEDAYWPHRSSRIEGRLNQEAELHGLRTISPGRNVQLIPYGVFRSFRVLDDLNPGLGWVGKNAELHGGLDAKVVLKDRLALDLALNPDFSQVESDEPQVTVNQRFEVFFPEKRPFFLENASFFDTPVNLLFTRRIADPELGVRLTGKLGPYAIGTLLVDDQAPARQVDTADPSAGRRAFFGVVRVSRDISRQSSLGMIFTNREFRGSSNRVGGIDGRMKLGQNWAVRFQGVASATTLLDGKRLSGPAYELQVSRSGRQLLYDLQYSDRSSGFETLAGFVPRTDLRRVNQHLRYAFRPEGRRLISWGPGLTVERTWDHAGTRLDELYEPDMRWELAGQTSVRIFYRGHHERLKPRDLPLLSQVQGFAQSSRGFSFSTNALPQLAARAGYSWGPRTNFFPVAGQSPALARGSEGNVTVTLRPGNSMVIDSTYIVSRLSNRNSSAMVFADRIFRSKWSWQLNRELSLRAILEYSTVLANRELTRLESRKSFNADFLVTYLVNPGTAVYLGFNSNFRDMDPTPDMSGPVPGGGLMNDGRQFFVKASYLFRF